MAFVIKFAKTVRNNWKKSIFLTGLLAWGTDFGNKKYQEHLLRIAYCLEAKKYGDLPCKDERPRRVTVFLNPAAQRGSGKKLFDTNVAPILHLAGLEVTVVKTEYEGQAKKYMDVIEDTDVVVVAGGNGTLLEVVTGLLRRKDQESTCQIPIGVIPLGATNTLARSLFMQGESEVRWMLEASMAVVKSQTKPIDIMCIKGDNNKTVYAVNSIHWGTFKDADERKSKYWYYGPLKHHFTYLWTTVRYWPQLVAAKLTYELPCEGCSKCYQPPPKPQWSWWHVILPPKVEVPKKDYSNITNEECGKKHETEFNTLEFSCRTCNHKQVRDDDRGMDVTIGKEVMTRLEFIKEGQRRIKVDPLEPVDSSIDKFTMGKFSLRPRLKEGREYWFSIDQEKFEAMPIEVDLQKDRVQVFFGDQNKAFV